MEEERRLEKIGEIIMRNWDFREIYMRKSNTKSDIVDMNTNLVCKISDVRCTKPNHVGSCNIASFHSYPPHLLPLYHLLSFTTQMSTEFTKCSHVLVSPMK